MNLIKSSSFKCGSFKGEEHSYIDSVNGTIKWLGEAWIVTPNEHQYFERGTQKDSDNIDLHEDEWLSNIKEYVPLVHRDLQAILYRGVSYVLSWWETKFNDVSKDVMKLIQNIVRLVDSKITIIHHFAQIQEARISQSDSDGYHNRGEVLAIPNSTTVKYQCDGEGKINMFDTEWDTENGRTDLIFESVTKVSDEHLSEARELLSDIIQWVKSLDTLGTVNFNNSHKGWLSHAWLRIHYLHDAIQAMVEWLEDIKSRIVDRIDFNSESNETL